MFYKYIYNLNRLEKSLWHSDIVYIVFAVQTVCVRGKHLTVEPCNYSHKHTHVWAHMWHNIYVYVHVCG